MGKSVSFWANGQMTPPQNLNRKVYYAIQQLSSWVRSILAANIPTDTAAVDECSGQAQLDAVLAGAAASVGHCGPAPIETISHFPSFLCDSSRRSVLKEAILGQSTVGKYLCPLWGFDRQEEGTPLSGERPSFVPVRRSSWLQAHWPEETVHDEFGHSTSLSSHWSSTIKEMRVWEDEHCPDGANFSPRFESGQSFKVAVDQFRQRIALNCDDALSISMKLDRLEHAALQYCRYLPDRSKLFEIEYLVQEIGLCELLKETISALPAVERWALDTIVDAGGGNGFLALHCTYQMRCSASVVVDCFFPRHSVDAPTAKLFWTDCPCDKRVTEKEREVRTIVRVQKYLHEVSWEDDVLSHSRTFALQPLGSKYSRRRGVANPSALLCKHLCGTAIDVFLRELDWQGQLPPVLVLSPCCYSKGRFEDYLNQDFLHQAMQVRDNSGWTELVKKTDWNFVESRRQVTSPRRCTVRTTSECCCGRKRHHLTVEEEWAYAASDVLHACLDSGRLTWLRERGYEAHIVEFAPKVITPKNKAIVAIYRGGEYFLPALTVRV